MVVKILEFKSLESMISYIEKQMSSTSINLSEKMVEIAKEQTENEQNKYSPSPNGYTRTGQLLNCITATSKSKDLIEIKWLNNGDWTSYRGTSFYAPLGLESGSTYGLGGYRPKTNFVELSENKIQDELPKYYKQMMISKGIPIV